MKNIDLLITTIFLLSLLAVLNGNAQSTQINWGEEFELEKKHTLSRVVGMDNEHYYIISGRVKKSEFELQTFGILDHKLKNTQSLNFEYDKTKYTFLNAISTAAGIFLYYFKNNESSNKIELHVAKIVEGVLTDFKLVHQQEKEKGLFSNHLLSSQVSVFGNGYKISVSQKTSPDKKFVILSYRQEIKGRFEEFQLLCLNENMEFEWDRKLDFEEEKKKLFIKNFSVNNDGAAYCLVEIQKYTFKEKAREVLQPIGKNASSNDYFFRVYKILEKEVESLDLSFDENLGFYPAKGILIFENGKSMPNFTGIYAAKKDGSEIKGSFYATINNLDSLSEVKLHPFKNISLISRNFRENLDKLDAPKPNYSYIKSHQFENGNRALILENYIVKSIKYYQKSNNTYKVETTYHSDELLLFLFDETGELLTDTMVKKQLWTENRSWSSYAGILGSKNLYLVYNHAMRRKERKAKGVKGTPTTMTIFNDQGEVSTETLFSNGNKAVIPYFYPKHVTKNKTHFLLGRFMSRKFTFGTIAIE